MDLLYGELRRGEGASFGLVTGCPKRIREKSPHPVAEPKENPRAGTENLLDLDRF